MVGSRERGWRRGRPLDDRAQLLERLRRSEEIAELESSYELGGAHSAVFVDIETLEGVLGLISAQRRGEGRRACHELDVVDVLIRICVHHEECRQRLRVAHAFLELGHRYRRRAGRGSSWVSSWGCRRDCSRGIMDEVTILEGRMELRRRDFAIMIDVQALEHVFSLLSGEGRCKGARGREELGKGYKAVAIRIHGGEDCVPCGSAHSVLEPCHCQMSGSARRLCSCLSRCPGRCMAEYSTLQHVEELSLAHVLVMVGVEAVEGVL
mmetsp:Transcript_74531/g.159744  ORF Transcript_74531/g.159744 Transcript_74531/m.159744 type:complete len:266 (+) Transcript_74531:698-1495(+)